MILPRFSVILMCVALGFFSSCRSELPPTQVRPWTEPARPAAKITREAETVSAGEGKTVTSANWGGGAELLGVSFAAEGGFIMVSYRMPVKKASRIFPGHASVTDENTEIVYKEVPVMPVVGPLIGRPKHEGQQGFVMLVNAPKRLKKGAVVTVELEGYRQEHVLVQ